MERRQVAGSALVSATALSGTEILGADESSCRAGSNPNPIRTPEGLPFAEEEIAIVGEPVVDSSWIPGSGIRKPPQVHTRKTQIGPFC